MAERPGTAVGAPGRSSAVALERTATGTAGTMQRTDSLR